VWDSKSFYFASLKISEAVVSRHRPCKPLEDPVPDLFELRKRTPGE
jgi:hypothetical protein